MSLRLLRITDGAELLESDNDGRLIRHSELEDEWLSLWEGGVANPNYDGAKVYIEVTQPSSKDFLPNLFRYFLRKYGLILTSEEKLIKPALSTKLILQNQENQILVLQEWLSNQRVAYHDHDSYAEHPVAVKDHAKYFSQTSKQKKQEIDRHIKNLLSEWIKSDLDIRSLGENLEKLSLSEKTFKHLIKIARQAKEAWKHKRTEETSKKLPELEILLHDKFPQFIKDFGGLHLVLNPANYRPIIRDHIKHSQALYSDDKIVYINADKNQTKSLLPEEAISARTLELTVIHEFGHHVYYSFLTQEQQQQWKTLYEKLFIGSYDAIVALRVAGKSVKLKGPTYYSMKNEREYFAEIFMLTFVDKQHVFFKKNPDIVALLREQKIW